MHFHAVHIARLEIGHAKRLRGGLARGGKNGRIFFLERQIIRREPITEEPGQLRFVEAVLL